MFDLLNYKGKKVFVTGHTGFKGSWMCKVLLQVGADVTGFSLAPPTTPSLFTLAGLQSEINSIIDDVCNLDALKSAMQQAQPEIVIHMAAQPIVLESYRDPVTTYATNVMGTVHVLEAARCCGSVRSIVNVTTDKVYQNNEWEWGYRETDRLGGHDPYSNSKACSELVTSSYIKSFFQQTEIAVSTCRAGNVIGGGDFAPNRIVPDCVRSVEKKKTIVVRNPYSIRPYQHVLEPVCTYLMIAGKQLEHSTLAGCYNIGPDDEDCISTGALVDLFCSCWGDSCSWVNVANPDAPHEANFLKLDCSRLKNTFDWKPHWHVQDAIMATCTWTKAFINQTSVSSIMHTQIDSFVTKPSI